MRLLLVAFLVSLVPTAWADIIYDNGAPITNPNTDCNSSCPSLTTSVASAVFDLSGDSTLTGVNFWTFQLAGAYQGGDLTWDIFADNSGVQGPLLGSGAFTLSTTAINSNVSVAGFVLSEYETSFNINNLALDSPGSQKYFLDITDASPQDLFGIFWATSGANTLAFQIAGTTANSDPSVLPTPEPTSALLLAGCVACIYSVKRLERNRHRG